MDLEVLLVHHIGINRAAERNALLANGVIDVTHGVADDDLVLAALLDDLQHALHLHEGVLVGLVLVLELEAQTSDAVRQGDDVILAAYPLNNLCGELVVLSHIPSLFSAGQGHARCRLLCDDREGFAAIGLADGYSVSSTAARPWVSRISAIMSMRRW